MLKTIDPKKLWIPSFSTKKSHSFFLYGPREMSVFGQASSKAFGTAKIEAFFR